jgi:protein phosphatase-4 regulatory subunit 3
MTQHESTIKQLADTSLGGHIFLGLIQRWEMNNEPPPPEEAKVERLVSLSLVTNPLLTPVIPASPKRASGDTAARWRRRRRTTSSRTTTRTRPWCASSRTRSPHSRAHSSANARARAAAGIPAGVAPPRLARAQHRSGTPALVDYADDDDDDAGAASADEAGVPPSKSPSPAPEAQAGEPSRTSPAPDLPPSPRGAAAGT